MRAHILSVVAYFIVTFGVQAANHFVINTAHYAREKIIAPEPVLWGGLAVIVIQGVILTFLYSRLRSRFAGPTGGLAFSLVMGAFLASYIALTEPSKYLISSKLEWALVEAGASTLQFAIFGVALGLIHATFGTPAVEGTDGSR
ncbi:hypothetical protein V1T76_27920 [Roseibium sp. FZY0029]|uniref:hypothetical protein n=1 Tax=Roseibium sp. FZY0029 TaxID=3116647 RepID=UPI002E9955EB|nr:hypothetical protein [Roseibium sp. FZY0029]